MARIGLRNHPKFRRLVAMLSMPEAYVLGHLQMLWETAYELGDAIGDATDVEVAAGWVGDPGVLCAALASCGGCGRSGFLDPDTSEGRQGCYVVHDLYENAPRYIKTRIYKKTRRMLGLGDPKGWIATRFRVLSRDKHVCRYCAGLADTVDHIVPRTHGGGHDDQNLVAACRSCNSRKKDRTPSEAGMLVMKGGE
jgi:hypothetical protein